MNHSLSWCLRAFDAVDRVSHLGLFTVIAQIN